MKLSDITAKLAGIPSFAVRTVATLALAGAALTAAAPAASAQQVAFGVQFGGPRYGEPVPVPRASYGYGYAPGYYAPHSDWREHEAHEAWERREAWEHREASERRGDWEHNGHEFRDHDFDGRRGYGYRSY